MLNYHRTIDDLVKFHPIRKSWDLVEEVLDEGHAIVDIDDEEVEEEGAEGETEVIELEEDDMEVIDEVEGEGVLAWSNITAPSSPVSSILTDDGLPPPTSDASAEFVDATDSDGGEGWEVLIQKRKAPDELSTGARRWKVARTGEAGMWLDDGSEVC